MLSIHYHYHIHLDKGCYQIDWHTQLIEQDVQKLLTVNQLTALHDSLLPLIGRDSCQIKSPSLQSIRLSASTDTPLF